MSQNSTPNKTQNPTNSSSYAQNSSTSASKPNIPPSKYSYSSSQAKPNLDHSSALAELQEHYELLRTNFQKLRRDFDEVNLEKRKLEIKLMNTNPEYYDKQIRRLRGELEKYQQLSEENKYLYLKAENSRKQIQASLKVKQDQLKAFIKTTQTLKIANTELKYQNQQKQKTFNRVRDQLQRSNSFISNRFEETQRKLTTTENKLKSLTLEHEILVKRNQKIEKNYQEQEEAFLKYKAISEERIKKISVDLEDAQNQSVKNKMSFSLRESQLADQINKYKSERTSVQLLTAKKNENVSAIKNTRMLELQLVRSEEKIKDLEFENTQKGQTIKRLKFNLDSGENVAHQELQYLNNQIKRSKEEKNNMIVKYERELSELKRQIEHLRIEKTDSGDRHQISPNRGNFQQILRTQLDQNSKLRKQLAMKIDQVFNLKSDIEQLKVEKDNMKSEMGVLQKICKSQEKNSKIGADIQTQNLKNQLESVQRKLEVMETKLTYKQKQIKEKDNFIISSIVGRSRKEDVPIIMADLQRIFENGYVQRLAEANQKIDELTNKLKNI